MKIFDSKYTFIKSWNEEVSSIFAPSVIILIFWFIITQKISILFLVLALIAIIPYFRGLGSIRINEETDGLNLLADGKLGLQGKVINIYSGWSYRFTPRLPTILSYGFPYFGTWRYFQRGRNGTSSTSPANTIVINVIFELENNEKVVIHQQLPPWREMPKGWKYVGNDMKHCQHFFKVRSGVKKLRNRLIN